MPPKLLSAKTSKTLKLKKEAPRSFPALEIPRSTSAADIASFVIMQARDREGSIGLLQDGRKAS